MERTLFLSILIVFFTTSLVGCNNKKDDYELQDKCKKSSEELFNREWKNIEHSSYQNHYNKKLNKCFIVVKHFDANEVYLYDVNENNIYGGFQKYENSTKCYVLEKKCNSEEEWDKLVKPYMED